jgi:hypothetical protein
VAIGTAFPIAFFYLKLHLQNIYKNKRTVDFGCFWLFSLVFGCRGLFRLFWLFLFMLKTVKTADFLRFRLFLFYQLLSVGCFCVFVASTLKKVNYNATLRGVLKKQPNG